MFKMQRKSFNLFSLKFILIEENPFALSIIVFEKSNLKIRVRIRPNFKFYAVAVLLCYYK